MVWQIIYYTATIIYAIVAAALSVVIIMENRNPIRTLAWIMLLIVFPIGGAIIYLFFGRDHRKKHILADRLDFGSNVIDSAKLTELGIPDNFQKLVKLIDNNQHSSLFNDNKVSVYANGSEIFDSLFADLDKAEKSIHIEFYIIEEGEVGNHLHDLLLKKAKEGVEVRVIYDYIGGMRLPIEWKRSLVDAGVKIHSFLTANSFSGLQYINYRNHRKLVIIDGEVGYTGGVNIADRYRLGNHLGLWRDTFIRVSGSAVKAMQHAFLIDWKFVCNYEKIELEDYVSEVKDENKGDEMMQIVTSGPDTEWPNILNGVLSAINNARKSVYIHTPYFIPPEPLMIALESAALSGVDVRLMLSENSDSLIVSTASRSYIDRMLRAGIRVFFYRYNFLHSKAIVIDDYLSILGTANMDIRSFEQNFEVAAFIYGEKTAGELSYHFEEDMKTCKELNLSAWRHRSVPKRIRESFARLLSPIF